MSKTTRIIAALGLCALGLASLAGLTACGGDDVYAASEKPPALLHGPAWPDEVKDALGSLPIQHKGRVKPLNTYAMYALMRMSGKKSVKVPVKGTADEPNDPADPDLVRIQPMEWLLDVLFFPEVARTQEVFLVEDDAVLTELGLDKNDARMGRKKKKKKRDYYSYDFLSGARAKIGELGERFHKVNPRERDTTQNAVVELAEAVVEYEVLLESLAFARRTAYPVEPALRARLGGRESVTFLELLKLAPEAFMELLAERQAPDVDLKEFEEEAKTYERFVRRVARDGMDRHGMSPSRILPPTPEQSAAIRKLVKARTAGNMHPELWLTPADALLQAAFQPLVPVAQGHLQMLADLEAMVAARKDMEAFTKHTRSLTRASREIAAPLGVEEKVEMESFLTKWKLLSYPMHFYLLAFVLVVVSWTFKKPKRWFDAIIWLSIIVPTVMLIWGITLRSLIRERPPMSTLYDTVLFIGAFIVVSGMVFEWLNKKRIALAMAPALGYLFVLIAGGYESIEAEDTMRQLPAVLDTNFWLATHVVCIAIGYAASLFTAAVGNIYVLGKVFGFKKQDSSFYLTLGRMLYGSLAFGLIFATIGTILGGIWANDSWGRFWGWDPKENGALMIVLWQLAMIHARLGGFIKTFGLAMSSLVLGGIVAFSWWGVNLLGIGLHSYGFVTGVKSNLMLYYALQLGVLLAGGVWWFLQNKAKGQAKPATP